MSDEEGIDEPTINGMNITPEIKMRSNDYRSSPLKHHQEASMISDTSTHHDARLGQTPS